MSVLWWPKMRSRVEKYTFLARTKHNYCHYFHIVRTELILNLMTLYLTQLIFCCHGYFNNCMVLEMI